MNEQQRMAIRMKPGVVNIRLEDGTVPYSADPFTVSRAEGERLVALGYAEEVSMEDAMKEVGRASNEFLDTLRRGVSESGLPDDALPPYAQPDEEVP